MDGLIYDRGRRKEGKKEQEEQEGGLGKARAYKEGSVVWYDRKGRTEDGVTYVQVLRVTSKWTDRFIQGSEVDSDWNGDDQGTL